MTLPHLKKEAIQKQKRKYCSQRERKIWLNKMKKK